MTNSERVSTEICKNSFLSFWSFPNPIREDNKKEFTDILIINNPIVIIISVKEIHIKYSGKPEVDEQRWFKRGIKKSYKQIYGAERIITDNITNVLTNDGKNILNIPDSSNIKIYRVGVSIGRKESFALPYGKFETGFVHFFDQDSFPRILNELDTIMDFIQYLEAKERFFNEGNKALFNREEDFLAVHLHNNRSMPSNFDRLLIDSDSWNDFIRGSEYKSRKKQEHDSYVWDNIIEEFFDGYKKDELLFSSNFTEIENGLRTMSKEARFNRMILSKTFLETIGFYGKSQIEARLCQSPSGVIYVFLVDQHDENNRESRVKHLQLLCFAARNCIDNPEVVGIASNRYIKGEGHSYDLCYLDIPKLTNDEREKIRKMQEELGYFTKSVFSKISYDEYPKEEV